MPALEADYVLFMQRGKDQSTLPPASPTSAPSVVRIPGFSSPFAEPVPASPPTATAAPALPASVPASPAQSSDGEDAQSSARAAASAGFSFLADSVEFGTLGISTPGGITVQLSSVKQQAGGNNAESWITVTVPPVFRVRFLALAS